MGGSSLALHEMIGFLKPMRLLLGVILAVPLLLGAGEGPAPEPSPKPAPGTEKDEGAPSPGLKAALKGLKLPGVNINLEKRCVDVESTVCLRDGMLEFIACTKDTKEHESIIMVEAKPSHIHTALLLLGAKPGHPAMRKAIDEEGTRFIDLPPRGGAVDVFLVVKDSEGEENELPISDFIVPSEREDGVGGAEDDEGDQFPTHTFVFAGSILHGEADGPRTYIADQSGSVISLSTFGDELLCLSGVHGHFNGALMWQVEGEKLPKVGSKITLRLRPQVRPQPVPKGGGSE